MLADTLYKPRPRRTRRFRLPRLLHALISLFLVWSAIETYSLSNHFDRIDRAAEYQDHAMPLSARIFIASIHWNDEEVLRSHWNNAVLDLVRALGPDRVFLSIYESGSYDNTKGAIRELDADLEDLGVPRKVVLSDVTHEDDIQVPDMEKGEGWIDTDEGERELRRIPYLARLRNQSLQPLEELARDGVVFDSVLFLNDVVFTPGDVLELLDTNGGDYAAACSLDFSSPPSYYDTFALRDSHGNGHVTHSWPYFRSSTSRRAMKVLAPVPVSSCLICSSIPTIFLHLTPHPDNYRS
ncbi:hypothetical protein SI65_05001 [Aspergillus cristatus]|uniref:Uncharacterized protein n=1 Tax=Aspergillus cristatus TaxID=573508 RepID=A0A1E3BGA7_ASPCR|nr:hypothetical protein SI65_05001 [Aspergillus cristatus]